MTIESILKDKGPLLSSDLITVIKQNEPGISDEAIRKRLSRVKSPIRKIQGFYTDNQAFFYLESQFNSQDYFESLKDSFKTAAKRLGSIIAALEYHDGFLRADHIGAYSFSPIKKLTGHKLLEAILKQLEELRLIRVEEGGIIP